MSPKDMDMDVSPQFTLTIHFSSPMHHTSGHVSLQSQSNTQINELAMETTCLNEKCTVSMVSALEPNTFYEIEFSSDYFVNQYNIPLQNPIRMLFRTSQYTCNTHSIQEGLGSSHLCSCFSNNDSCTCSCGDVQINRGLV